MRSRKLVLLILAGALSGCGLKPSGDTPPLQVHPDMDNQPKYKAQSASAFYADGRSNRPAVPGTIAYDKLQEDDAVATGMIGNDLVKNIPVPITEALLKRGQERFNINCAPCHGRAAEGNGIVKVRSQGALNPANLQEARLREVADGHIFNVITNGIRTMQPLAHQTTVQDRWAIIAYVRALQRSQNANVKDVPAGTSIKDADPSATPVAAASAPVTSPAASPSAAASKATVAPTKK